MKLGLLIGLLTIVVLAAGCAVPQQPTKTITPPVLEVESSTAPARESAQVYHVTIENGNLMPVDVEINAGDRVEWANKDNVRYTLRSGAFEERLPVGGTFEYLFTKPGIVGYTALVVEDDFEDNNQGELQGKIIVG